MMNAAHRTFDRRHRSADRDGGRLDDCCRGVDHFDRDFYLADRRPIVRDRRLTPGDPRPIVRDRRPGLAAPRSHHDTSASPQNQESIVWPGDARRSAPSPSSMAPDGQGACLADGPDRPLAVCRAVRVGLAQDAGAVVRALRAKRRPRSSSVSSRAPEATLCTLAY